MSLIRIVALVALVAAASATRDLMAGHSMALPEAPEGQTICHVSAYNVPDKTCAEIVEIKAQIRAACEPSTGVDVKVTQVECELECGAIKMIQQVPSEAHWDIFDTCEHDHQLYKDFLSGNGASACKPAVNDQICPAMPQPICHVSAYKSDLTCQELVDVKAQIRANCEGPTGVNVDVTEILCEPGCDGTMRMIQQVPSEAMWDIYDTCEHDDPLYVQHLSGKGASDCKPPVNDLTCDVMAVIPEPMMM